MPLPLGPTLFSCRTCGWRATTDPRGDVVLPGLTWYERCPKCAGEVEIRRASLISSLAPRLRRLLGRP